MDRRDELLTALLSTPDMRALFPSLAREPGGYMDPELFRILERMWPIVRETSTSDEECAEEIGILMRVIAALADSGRI